MSVASYYAPVKPADAVISLPTDTTRHWRDERLVSLIIRFKMQCCAEIGVESGHSLVVQARAMKFLGSGVVYGIDPWSYEDNKEGVIDSANPNWVGNRPDFEQTYVACLERLAKYDMGKFCKLIRKKSREAVDLFKDESLDMLYIDGNHSERVSFEDAVLYFPKVRPGGYIVYDDLGWIDGGKPSTTKGFNYLLSMGCKEIENKDVAILRKPGCEACVSSQDAQDRKKRQSCNCLGGARE